MKGDKTVIEFLNKALRHELTAVNQYWLHYRLLDNWGYKELAKTWRKESIEEMWHADKLIDASSFGWSSQYADAGFSSYREDREGRAR